MKIKKAVALSTVLGIALAGMAFASPSNADPVSGGFVITGSDTLQDAVNALVNGTTISGATVRVTAGGNPVASYDATGSTVIQTKPGGPFMGRPSGSGDGKSSLSRSLDGQNFSKNGIVGPITGQVDLARSSSGAGSGANGGVNETDGPLVFIPFGRDAVSYVFKFGTGATLANTPGIDTLTQAQLTQIYGTNAPFTLPGSTTTIVPKLPQAASGTRQFFVGALFGSANAKSNPAGVPDAATTTVIENDASALAPAAGEVWIIPFSAASFVAQANKATAINTTGTVLGVPSATVGMGAIGGVAAFTVTGAGTSAAALVPNSTFYNSTTFGRDVYIIAPTAAVEGANSTSDLAKLVDPTRILSLTYFGSSNAPGTAKAVKLKFGFLTPLGGSFHTNYFS